MKFFDRGNQEIIGNRCDLSPPSVIFVSLLSIESLLFGLFTSCMFGDQMHSIAVNKTYIDRLKDKRQHSSQSPEDLSKIEKNIYFGCCISVPRQCTFVLHLREVVGDASPVWWLLPVLPYWNNRDEIFGFCEPGSRLGRETKYQMLSRFDNEELPEI